MTASHKRFIWKKDFSTLSRVYSFEYVVLGSYSSEIYTNYSNYYLMYFMLLVAWLQVSKGKAPVIAVFKKNGEYKHAGSVIAESKCWSMLKGGLTIDESGPAELYFEVFTYTNKHSLCANS